MLQGKCQCCCQYHCRVSFHNLYGTKSYHQKLPSPEIDSLLVSDSGSYCPDEPCDVMEESTEFDSFTSLVMSNHLFLD